MACIMSSMSMPENPGVIGAFAPAGLALCSAPPGLDAPSGDALGPSDARADVGVAGAGFGSVRAYFSTSRWAVS